MTQYEPPGHAFISYVREDKDSVDRLQQVLVAAGIRVWRDTEDLWPGQDWKLEIKRAINDGSLAFLACFSDSSNAREVSYQREELILAVEQMRQRTLGRPWLIPIRFSDCDVPEYDLGANRSLNSLQRVDLYGDKWELGGPRLISAIMAILGARQARAASVPRSASETARPANTLRQVLLDPNRQIEFEDLIDRTMREARDRILDETEFPTDTPRLVAGPDGLEYILEQVRKYESVMRPLMELLVIGCTWGRPEHNGIWARVVQTIANTHKMMGGKTVLVNLRRYALILLVYAAAVAAVNRSNFAALKAVTIDPLYRSQTGRVPVVGVSHVWLLFESYEIGAQVLAKHDGRDGFDRDLVERLMQRKESKFYTPVSDHLQRLIRPLFAEMIVDDDDFVECFDRTEAILALLATDVELQAVTANRSRGYGPWFGSFTWRHQYFEGGPAHDLLSKSNEDGDRWPPLRVGLFGGSQDRAKAAFDRFLPEVEQAHRRFL